MRHSPTAIRSALVASLFALLSADAAHAQQQAANPMTSSPMSPELVTGAPPSIFGKRLEGPMVGHQPIMPDGLHHYDLHVWLWKSNTLGVFSATNPTVKCPKSPYSFAEDAPKMAPHGHKP